MDILIEKYLNDLNTLRSTNNFTDYELRIVDNNDINQVNRYRLGVGLFNDLNINTDYNIVKTLFSEQIKCMKSNPQNFDHEIIYMYLYFISEFNNLNDIWDYAELKFSEDMDSDIGFDTEFFLTYGKENLRNYLKHSTHRLTEKVQSKIFGNELAYDDETADEYRKGKIAFFGLKKPITNNLHFCQTLDERDFFRIEFEKYKLTINLSDFRQAYDYINYSRYTENNKEICLALNSFILHHPDNSFRKNFENEKKKYCM